MAFEYLPEALEHDSRFSRRTEIAQRIADDIARGTLRPGDKLPGSRVLAARFGVHRNTLNAALSELSAQGWVVVEPARGVFVRARDRGDDPKPFARGCTLRERLPERAGFELAPLHDRGNAGDMAPRGVLALHGGLPDPRLFPHALLSRAYRRVLAQKPTELLDYGDAQGHPRLRRGLSDMLNKMRGLSAGEDDVLVTRGSQQAIWLAAQCIMRPGDRVAVEALGYPPAWEALKGAGAALVPIAIDGEGLRLDALEHALAAGSLRAIYLTPHHQHPTMVALSGQRRLALLALAKRHRIAIIEDDYSFELQYEGSPRLPLASADHTGQVVYIGSLSKVLAPGLRIGFAVAPKPILKRMAAMRTLIDRQGDAIAEAAVAELMEDGEVQRHIRRTRREYKARRDLTVSLLEKKLGDHISFAVPPGGMALWLRVKGGASVEQWAARARERNVWFRPGGELALRPRAMPFARLCYTRCDQRELTRAIKVMADTF